MACFLVPVAEALVTTIAAKAIRAKERKPQKNAPVASKPEGEAPELEIEGKLPFSKKLHWLSNLLWGGSALLAFEHVWHGEVVPWFPFLTAAADPAEASVMLQEMSTVGVTMAVLVTAVWCVMLLVAGTMEKKALKAQAVAQ